MLAPARWLSTCVVFVALLAACGDPDPVGPLSPRLTGAAPTNLTATANSYSDISLAWQDNSTNETGWEVHRSTTGPTGTFALFTTYPWPNTTTGGNGGLQGSTEYCYKVRSYKNQGRQVSYSEFSNVACATTLAPPLPAAPSGVSATPFGTSINVTWTDNASNETGFRVERAASSTGPWTSIGTTSANGTSRSDAPVAVEQQACYRVFAVNGFGDSDPSNVDCTTPPATPTNLAVITSGSDAELTWTDNSLVEDGFVVARASAGSSWSDVATVAANATGYRDGPLADGTYWYLVRATKDGGRSNNSTAVQVVIATTPPSAPTAVVTRPTGSTVVEIMWTDASQTEQGFRIERSTDGGASWVTAGTVAMDVTVFYDAAVTEQAVCHRAVAFNGIGESSPSPSDCTVPPAAPTHFTATDVGGAAVDFAWTDNSAAEDGYQLFYEECYYDYYYGGYCYDVFVGQVGPNITSFRLEPWQGSVWFFVVASRDGGQSDRAWATP
jgi:hypothetical protein